MARNFYVASYSKSNLVQNSCSWKLASILQANESNLNFFWDIIVQLRCASQIKWVNHDFWDARRSCITFSASFLFSNSQHFSDLHKILITPNQTWFFTDKSKCLKILSPDVITKANEHLEKFSSKYRNDPKCISQSFVLLPMIWGQWSAYGFSSWKKQKGIPRKTHYREILSWRYGHGWTIF